RPDAERDEIARQRLGRCELDTLLAVAERRFFYDRRVAHRDERRRYVERELPRHLEIRLVDAWKHPARVGRLELRVHVGRAPGGLVERARGVVVRDLAGVFELYVPVAGGEWRIGAQLEQLVAARRDGK